MEIKEIDELGQMSFKEYCKNIVEVVDSTAISYCSLIKTGLDALRKIISTNECPHDEVSLLEYFLENKKQYRKGFEEERNHAGDCFVDFVTVAKHYIKYQEFLEQRQQGGNVKIQEIHKKALVIYETYHKNTGHTFYLRKNRSEDKTKDKLSNGYWFQGDDDYVLTSPFKPADTYHKTLRFGFLINDKKECSLRFAYGALSQDEEQYKDFYEKVLDHFNIKYNELSGIHTKDIIYSSTQNWATELEKFLHNDVKELIEIAKKHNIPDEYLFFSSLEFEKRLNRIREI